MTTMRSLVKVELSRQGYHVGRCEDEPGGIELFMVAMMVDADIEGQHAFLQPGGEA